MAFLRVLVVIVIWPPLDAAGVWVYGDFMMKTPRRPEGWTVGRRERMEQAAGQSVRSARFFAYTVCKRSQPVLR